MKKIMAFILISFFIYYSITAYKHFTQSPPKGDEVHYLLTTISIIKNGNLIIGERYDHKDYKLWYQTLDRHSVKGGDGNEYMYHGLGLYPFILAPGYFLAGRFGSMLTMVFFAIGSLYFLTKVVEKTSDSKIITFFTILVLGVSLPFTEYSYLIFPEIVGVFMISAIIWFTINNKNELVTFLLIGLLPWIHIRFLVISLSICVIYILKNKITKRKIFLSFISLSIIATYFIFLWRIYGSFDPRYPYILANVQVKPANPLLNLINAIVDGQYGLFWYSPFIALVIPGFLYLYRKNKTTALSLLFPLALYLLSTFSYYDWNGGYSPPGRYLLVVFPFLIPFISFFYKKIKKRSLVLINIFFAVWGIILYFINFFKVPDFGFIYSDGYVFFIHQISDFIRYDLTKYIPHFYSEGITNQQHYLYFTIFVITGLILYRLTNKTKT